MFVGAAFGAASPQPAAASVAVAATEPARPRNCLRVKPLMASRRV
jgi:hypothetical protein